MWSTLYKKLGSGFVLRLEQGDDILKTLREFANVQRLHACFFEGIGSLYKAVLGHYDFKDTKTYKYETFAEDLEILDCGRGRLFWILVRVEQCNLAQRQRLRRC